MKKVRVGVLGPADIAKRRMIPALEKSEYCEYTGVAVALPEERSEKSKKTDPSEKTDTTEAYKRGHEKADELKRAFDGKVFDGFKSMIESDDIDAVYIALPPYLHAKWAREALMHGKHVLLEKPFTTSLKDTQKLIDIAKERNLAVIENFGFVYHPQIKRIREIIESGDIGEIRLIRSNFGFPHRGEGDFRYKKELGGGALLDCGCYTLKLAGLLLGDSMKIKDSRLVCLPGQNFDMYGTVTADNEKGIPMQLSFGMDQQYCCNLEIWGNKGSIISPRIYTAPAGYNVELTVTKGMDVDKIIVDDADQFCLVTDRFADLVNNEDDRELIYGEILTQSRRVEEVLHR